MSIRKMFSLTRCAIWIGFIIQYHQCWSAFKTIFIVWLCIIPSNLSKKCNSPDCHARLSLATCFNGMNISSLCENKYRNSYDICCCFPLPKCILQLWQDTKIQPTFHSQLITCFYLRGTEYIQLIFIMTTTRKHRPDDKILFVYRMVMLLNL